MDQMIYPGAKILERKTGENISLHLHMIENLLNLFDGDKVHRHMMDGDDYVSYLIVNLLFIDFQ